MRKLFKTLRVLGCVVVSIALFWGIVNIFPGNKVVDVNPWIATERTQISAHRGGAELNPENTEKAFDYVITGEASYVDIVEIDIHITADNYLVINHDGTLNRMACAEGESDVKISTSNYADLKNYNLGRNFVARDGSQPYLNYTIAEADAAGLTIMTLEEFLTKYKESRDFKLLLEIKDKGESANKLADKVYELFNSEEYSWWKERTMIISFTDTLIDYIIENYEDQFVSPLGYKIAPQLITQALGMDCLVAPKYHCFSTSMTNSAGPITIDCATKTMVDGAHKRNQAITYWTIDDKESMEHLIGIGADVITTNAPDKLAEVLGLI